ncbi:MarR family winged helix-turn-helix transcriptional regulator [Streptococcus mutans]|uniref:MarR family winged helix-turn-helix transcriptional regulator n=1 Tax=Streptococcus mutans TaxID=1309 RepID=UPI0002ECEE77|nr:MarR family winged helix-turn-helix transcriptional regulator [Streptococcus mutans]QIQ93906.1 winged helix-turn-helix transcriptional regulator [Streptococcus mutans]QIR00147.1 winged helix-turn-helix transcriptional regulator [Streptococcus mutans]QIR01797.1 winged helix-turn-helix transcriptional regulator [Streptococcus mutans]QIR03927.1 winged helix-turn-helix transcriptional regulator [Streptococcus mutans]
MKEPFSEFKNLITATERYIQKLSKSHGVEHLSGPQGWTVMFLKDNQGKEIFIKDIEKRLDISKSVTSNLIKRMEKNGFISVIPSRKDRRYKQIVLTPLGQEKAGKITVFLTDLKKLLLKDISQEDLSVARKVFKQIKQNLEKKE